MLKAVFTLITTFYLCSSVFASNTIDMNINKYKVSGFYTNPGLYNLGYVDTSMIYYLNPTLINTTNIDYKISDIKPTCSCTKVTAKPISLQKKDSINIPIEFNSWGFKNGKEITKNVWIMAETPFHTTKIKFYYRAIISYDTAPIKLNKRIFNSKNGMITIGLSSSEKYDSIEIMGNHSNLKLISNSGIKIGENSLRFKLKTTQTQFIRSTITLKAQNSNREMIFSIPVLLTP